MPGGGGRYQVRQLYRYNNSLVACIDTVLIVIARKFLYLNFQRRLFQQYSCPLEIFLQVSPDKNGIAVISNVFIKFNRLKSEMALKVP